MISRIFPHSILLGVVLSMTFASCRPASYQIIKPKKERRDQGDPLGPTPEAEKAAPTAAIEVIKGGQSVTKVRVNEPTTIRPTADTLDPDDVGKSSCANPGIVRAQYQVASEATPEVNRGTNCDDLGVPYTFKTAGDYLLTMIVTTEEGETAQSSMTLHVIAANAPADEDGGFMIKANPLIVGIGQEVSLNGICTTNKPNQIVWNYGDGTNGEGANSKHAYGKTGSYRIDATCKETVANGRSWTASVTVVVMEKPVTPPASSTPPGYATPNPGKGGDVGQNTGTERPGQTPLFPPFHHSQPAQPVGSPGPVGTAPKKCGVFIFTWSC